MTGGVRTRWPWALWVLALLLVGATITLTVLNGSFSTDPVFIPLAIAMVLGYTTVGALLSARNPRNPLGWLMVGIGVLFILSGLVDEYTTYALLTNPGGLPFGSTAGQ